MENTEERIDAMRAMYEGGAGLREVGAAFGITPQRVQQLFVHYGIERRPRGVEPRNPQEAVKDKIVRDYLAGATRRDLAEGYGVSRRAVKQLLRERLSPAEVDTRNRERAAARPARRRDWADYELVSALKACAKDLGTPTFGVKKYAAWRRGQEIEYPSPALFHQRRPEYAEDTGGASWNEWRRLAGLPVKERPEQLGRTKFSNDEMYGALAEVSGHVGRFPSLREYDENRDAAQPTAGAIRRRHSGKWGAVREKYEAWREVKV